MRSWNDNLKKLAYVLVVIALIPVVWLLIVGSTSKRRIDSRWLERDFRSVKAMVYEHVDPFWKNPREKFEKAIEHAEKSIKRMHRMDFFLLIQPIFALLEDHESRVHFGMPDYMPVLPFKVAIREGKLLAYDSVSPYVKNGSEIETFDKMTSTEFLEWLKNYVGAESEAQWEESAEQFVFRLPSIQRKEWYPLKIGGKRRKIYSLPISKYRELRNKYYGYEEPFELTEKEGINILKIQSFSMWGQDIQNFEDDVEKLAKEGRPLIVDLRDNAGGSWKMVEVLIKHLVNKTVSFRREVTFAKNQVCTGKSQVESVKINPEKPFFNGRILVLVNRRTLDEAYDAALLLSKVATIAGEKPDIGNFRFFNVHYKSLPSVGMYFTISCAKMKYLDRLRIDVPLNENFGEYSKRISGKADSILKKAIEVIK